VGQKSGIFFKNCVLRKRGVFRGMAPSLLYYSLEATTQINFQQWGESMNHHLQPITAAKPARNVLLVDDDEDLAQLLNVFLKEKIEDAKVHIATDPYEAINMMAEQSFDLVVLDWNLQGVNGRETLLEAEKGFDYDPNLPDQWRQKSTPVIILSGDSKDQCELENLRYFNYAGHVNKKNGLDRVMDAIHAHYLLTV
jgi:CheY-like chemotaxis protein